MKSTMMSCPLLVTSMLERAGRELHDSGTLGFLDGAIGYADLQRRFGS